jgi:hypothetical protein
MGILWIVAGVIVVSAAFFLPSGGDVWTSLDAAGVAAALYLVALVAFATRYPFPRWSRAAAWFLFLLTGAGVFTCWREAEGRARMQVKGFREIRGSISRSVMVDVMPSMLLKVMNAYYAEPADRRQSLGEIFRETYPSANPGVNMHVPFSSEDSLMVSVSSLSDTAISLVGQEAYVPGRDPAFKNSNGKNGMVQARAVLTKEGVRYEAEN